MTAACAALLALTIGAITGVYAIVEAVVLRPLAIAEQDRVVVIWQRDDRRALPLIEVAYGEHVDWKARNRSLDDVAVFGSVNWDLTLVERTEPQSVPIAAVSASFFSVVGTRPLVGRPLEPADDEGAVPRSIVISHGLWQRRFGRDANVLRAPIGAKLNVDGPVLPIQVVGVMPAGFDFPRGADAWVPAAPLVRAFTAASGETDQALAILRVFFALGRLNEGVSVERATEELTTVMRTADRKGGPEPPASLVITPIARHLLGPASPVLWTLLAGTALMLAIACANVAGLLVSRSARKERALAIRLAIGASHTRLMSQTLIETAMVTAVALTASPLVGFIVSRGLVALAPSEVPRLESVTLFEPAVAAVCAAAAFLSLLVAGGLPAVLASRVDAPRVLAHGAHAGASSSSRRIQRGFVIAQIGVALTLVAGTGLFVKTVRGLDRTTLGFEPAGLVALSVSPGTDDLSRWNAFYEALIERVSALPGVEATAGVSLRPLSGPVGWDSQPMFPGQVLDQPSTWALNPHTNLEVVTPEYFDTMKIALRRGRLFTARDSATAPGVAIVSENTASRLWPGKDPIGQRLRDPSLRAAKPGDLTVWQTVVGVVADVRYRGLNDLRLDLYLPHSQVTNKVQQLMVQSTGNPADLVGAIGGAARSLDAGASVSEATLMTDVVASESAPWRFLMRVFGGFAALAAALAAVGLGAIVALTVAARKRELAIRAALGATRGQLRVMVVAETLKLVAAGIVAGLVGALLVGGAVAHVLIDVRPHNPAVLAGTAVLLVVAGMVASWLPARTAGDASPLELLKSE